MITVSSNVWQGFSEDASSSTEAQRNPRSFLGASPPLCVAFRYRLACAAIAVASAFAPGTTTSGQGQPAQQPVQPLPADAPFTVAVATSTLEAAPVYLAVARAGSANFDLSIAEEARR